jgi:EAL domain-containing protein (putative c-di-GMP-specific phosphodiesterase class I)
VAIAGDEPVEAARLIARADAAAYRGKRNGRGRVEVYDRELEYHLERRNVVRSAVLRLASAAEAPLVGQPIVGLADGVTIGYQVEVDWRALGVEPSEAIGLLAEDNHSARAAGLAMLQAGIDAVATWAAPPGGRSPGIGLRFPSRYVLDPDFVPCLRDALGRRSVPPSLVWVGIPADAFNHDREHATWTAKALARLGHGVALDGFGSAASLGKLRAASAHTVVLAPDLHDGIADDPDAYTLCRGVVALAHDLGLVTAVREVRDERVLARLTEIGCHFAIGDVFGPPLPTTELATGAAAPIGS